MKDFVLFHFPLDTIGFNKVILLPYLYLSQLVWKRPPERTDEHSTNMLVVTASFIG